MVKKLKCFSDTAHPRCHIETTGVYAGCSGRYVHNNPPPIRTEGYEDLKNHYLVKRRASHLK